MPSNSATLTSAGSPDTSAPLSSEERKLFGNFVAVVVLVAAPGKFLFYIAPVVLILISIFRGQFIRTWRLIGLTLGTLTLSLLTIGFDLADGGHANLAGLAFGILTYLPIFILWCLSDSFRVSASFAWRLANVCVPFILIEASLGFVQWVITRDGDFVSGTFGLYDALTGDKTISQVNFCFTLFCMAVYCCIWIQSRRMQFASLLALAAALVAETAHQTIFFILLIPALAVTGGNRLARLAISSFTTCVIAAGAVLVDPGLMSNINGWIFRVLLDPKSPKYLAVSGATEFMRGKNLLIGVGLGQFSSRASILSSGSGTSISLPTALVDTSSYYEKYMSLPVFLFQRGGENSAMAMPYFSVLSLITEFGAVISLVILYKTFRAVLENIRLGSIGGEAWRLSCYCNFFIGFVVLCSLIQNYLELTQALMIPILLYIVCKARLRSFEGTEVAEYH